MFFTTIYGSPCYLLILQRHYSSCSCLQHRRLLYLADMCRRHYMLSAACRHIHSVAHCDLITLWTRPIRYGPGSFAVSCHMTWNFYFTDCMWPVRLLWHFVIDLKPNCLGEHTEPRDRTLKDGRGTVLSSTSCVVCKPHSFLLWHPSIESENPVYFVNKSLNKNNTVTSQTWD